jgi:nucleoside-diphosphate-sugar epimerase
VNVIIFGASGMIGQGALRECLQDPLVTGVLTVGRRPLGQTHRKLRDLVHDDFSNFSSVEKELSGFDACFYCLGVTSAGMSEADYRRVTYDTTLSVAEVLVRNNPGMTFVFVSGTGADSTERGALMWARVKGAAENAVLALPFKAVYVFRPGFVQPLHGIKSRTNLYNAAYVLTAPIFPLLKAIAPRYLTTTEEIGRAMISVAAHGSATRIFENPDIIAAASAR